MEPEDKPAGFDTLYRAVKWDGAAIEKESVRFRQTDEIPQGFSPSIAVDASIRHAMRALQGKRAGTEVTYFPFRDAATARIRYSLRLCSGGDNID